MDQKAPLTGKKEEEFSVEDEVLYEKLNLPTRPFRPLSAKTSDLLKQKRQSNPKHPPINLKRNQPRYQADSSVLTRLKPRRIAMDKERLYEDNMALKLKNNTMLQEILKLRTKIAQVERDLAKKEDQSDSSQFSKPVHMINNLKNTVKDLKNEISGKNEEIYKLRKNIKSTKITEIELEVQAYIDECTRLRHHLEEIMRQRNTPPMSQVQTEEKSMQNTFLVNNVKKENEDLGIALGQANGEIGKLKGKLKEFEKEKKKNAVKKGEIMQAKSENLKLKSKVEHYARELAEKEAGFKEELTKVRRSLNEAYSKVNNFEGKIKDLIYENEEKSRQIKFLQESKMLNKVKEEKVEVKEKDVKSVKVKEDKKAELNTKSKRDESKEKFEEEKKPKVIEEHKIIKFPDADNSSKDSENLEDSKEKEADKDFEVFKDPKAVTNEEKIIPVSEVQPKSESNNPKPATKVSVDYEDFQDDFEEYDDQFEAVESIKQHPEEKLIKTEPKTLPVIPEPKAEVIPDKPKEKKGKKSKKKSSKSPEKKEKLPKEVETLLLHLALRMQINRVPKSKLFSTLFKNASSDKSVTKQELSNILQKNPFNFNLNETEKIADFFIDSKVATTKNIEEKVFKFTDNWEIFTPDEEEQFDEVIGETILSHKDTLIDQCKKHDKDDNGTIPLSVFKKVLTQSSIKMPEKVMKYMQLLFYSHSMQVDEVPYLNFIKAYTEQGGEDAEMIDEEKAKVARQYLSVMAQILIEHKKTVFDVFECDENGIILPNEFFAGLQRMGLEEIQEEHVMVLFEALQYDQAEEVCIHVEELEEILNHYGVNKVEEEELEVGAKHQKKVSMLDSDNYELSEDSPEKIVKKGSDKGLSESSPFTKNKSLGGGDSEYDEDFTS